MKRNGVDQAFCESLYLYLSFGPGFRTSVYTGFYSFGTDLFTDVHSIIEAACENVECPSANVRRINGPR